LTSLGLFINLPFYVTFIFSLSCNALPAFSFATAEIVTVEEVKVEAFEFDETLVDYERPE